MQTCNLMGNVASAEGRYEEARAWYERSSELAQRRGDMRALSSALHNTGVTCQEEADAARQRGESGLAEDLLRAAESFLTRSVTMIERVGDVPTTARSHAQLARVLVSLGRLQDAEDHARRALDIMEPLGMWDLHILYSTLGAIARSRGDAAGTAEWAAKREEAAAQQGRQGGTRDPSGGFVSAVRALAFACARLAHEGSPLGVPEQEAIARFEMAPAPLDRLPAFFNSLVAGERPRVPEGLPPEVAQVLASALEAIESDG